jgi:hypothetical protein
VEGQPVVGVGTGILHEIRHTLHATLLPPGLVSRWSKGCSKPCARSACWQQDTSR